MVCRQAEEMVILYRPGKVYISCEEGYLLHNTTTEEATMQDLAVSNHWTSMKWSNAKTTVIHCTSAGRLSEGNRQCICGWFKYFEETTIKCVCVAYEFIDWPGKPQVYLTLVTAGNLPAKSCSNHWTSVRESPYLWSVVVVILSQMFCMRVACQL